MWTQCISRGNLNVIVAVVLVKFVVVVVYSYCYCYCYRYHFYCYFYGLDQLNVAEIDRIIERLATLYIEISEVALAECVREEHVNRRRTFSRHRKII